VWTLTHRLMDRIQICWGRGSLEGSLSGALVALAVAMSKRDFSGGRRLVSTGDAWFGRPNRVRFCPVHRIATPVNGNVGG